jgi:hypothetical protein
MERREAIKISVAAIAAGGVGAVTLTTAFKPDIKPAATPEKLGWTQKDSPWTYLSTTHSSDHSWSFLN